MSVFVVAGFLVVVSVICAILATFLAHGYLWDRMQPGSVVGLTGGVLCAGMAFGMFWTLNPDPPERGTRPSVGATAEMTGLSALLWLPLYLYGFNAVARRQRRRAGPET